MSVLQGFTLLVSCGVLLSVQSSRGSEIIDGNVVVPHSLPYMALLENKTGPCCGGTLISPLWVLTAAHCDEARLTKVLLGVHSIKEKEKDSRQVRKIKSKVPHPCYDPDDNVNDLMLLKLDKAVKKSETVKILSPSDKVKEPAAGSKCLVAGWGTTKNKGKMSDVLKSANVTVIERAKCNSAEYYNLKPVITRNMICAGSDGNNSADTCQGDSGGPLVCNGALVGVTSFGKKCGLRKKPGVYAFISEKQYSWIKKTVKKFEI